MIIFAELSYTHLKQRFEEWLHCSWQGMTWKYIVISFLMNTAAIHQTFSSSCCSQRQLELFYMWHILLIEAPWLKSGISSMQKAIYSEHNLYRWLQRKPFLLMIQRHLQFLACSHRGVSKIKQQKSLSKYLDHLQQYLHVYSNGQLGLSRFEGHLSHTEGLKKKWS